MADPVKDVHIWISMYVKFFGHKLEVAHRPHIFHC